MAMIEAKFRFLMMKRKGVLPAKHNSRWDRLSDRAAAFKAGKEQNLPMQSKEV